MLTQQRVNELLSYDPETGVFTRLIGRARQPVGARAGTVNAVGYRYISLDGHKYTAHRLAWLAVHGCWPLEIDHINGLKDDNRIANLRDVTRAINLQNRHRPQGRNRLMWVSRQAGGKWLAQFNANGEHFRVGAFADEDEAYRAVLARRLAMGLPVPLINSSGSPSIQQQEAA